MKYSHRWVVNCGTCKTRRHELVSEWMARLLAHWHCVFTRHPFGQMTISIGAINEKGWTAE